MGHLLQVRAPLLKQETSVRKGGRATALHAVSFHLFFWPACWVSVDKVCEKNCQCQLSFREMRPNEPPPQPAVCVVMVAGNQSPHEYGGPMGASLHWFKEQGVLAQWTLKWPYEYGCAKLWNFALRRLTVPSKWRPSSRSLYLIVVCFSSALILCCALISAVWQGLDHHSKKTKCRLIVKNPTSEAVAANAARLWLGTFCLSTCSRLLFKIPRTHSTPTPPRNQTRIRKLELCFTYKRLFWADRLFLKKSFGWEVKRLQAHKNKSRCLHLTWLLYRTAVTVAKNNSTILENFLLN